MSFKFAVRDDDINFFTEASKLRSIYEPLFHLCKPTLCITPFAGDIYKSVVDKEGQINTKEGRLKFVKEIEINDNNLNYIDENKELILLLKEWLSEDKIGIALHGITHNPTSNGYECEVKEQYKSLEYAKKYLEELLGKEIKVFSAPNNTINRYWKKKVSRLGMDIVLSYGSKPNEVVYSVQSLFSMLKLYFHFIMHGKGVFYPFVLDYKDYSEIASYPQGVKTKLSEVQKNCLFAIKKGGVFVLAIHSYAFLKHPEMLEQFREICLYLSNISMPVSLEDVFLHEKSS